MPDGVAVSVTTVFGGNVVLHVPLVTPAVIAQLMPLGELVTTPVPVPLPVTAMPCVLNTGCAVRPCDIASWQGSTVQSPAQPLNTALPLADCCRVTMLPAANDALQLPLDVEPVTTQLIPEGMLVITPLPDDPAPGVIVRRCGPAVNPTLTADVIPLVVGSVQVAPVQAPVNPSKLPALLPPALSVTVLPAANEALHMPLVTPAVLVHEMPDGELVTLPVPVPAPLIAMMPAGSARSGGTTGGGGAGAGGVGAGGVGSPAMRYVTSTVRCAFIVSTHGLPVQLLLHASKTAPPTGSCWRSTTVPIA
ncbi:MAG TPA: hypothetical protein VE861_06470 [Gemmatimonadaceae bacterium]|nr:hypothetical protein [Gemmatimonadaceae bacterium]